MAEFLLKNHTCGENPMKKAYQIFKLLKGISRDMFISIVKDCLKRRSPGLKTLLSYLHVKLKKEIETVQPQNKSLLTITYQARTLEEYDDESEHS